MSSHGTDEVNSPVKEFVAHEKTNLGDVDNAAVLRRIDQNALLPIVTDEGTMHPKCFFFYMYLLLVVVVLAHGRLCYPKCFFSYIPIACS